MEILFKTILYLILIYSIFKIVFVFSKRRRKKDLYKMIEISFLEKHFKVDVRKIKIERLLNIIAMSNAIVFTTVLMSTMFIDILIIRELVSFILLFPTIYLVYYFVSKYLKKKVIKK